MVMWMRLGISKEKKMLTDNPKKMAATLIQEILGCDWEVIDNLDQVIYWAALDKVREMKKQTSNGVINMEERVMW